MKETGRSSTAKVANPVNVVIFPDAGTDGRAKHTSRVESPAGHAATNGAQETKGQANGKWCKGVLGVPPGSVDCEVARLNRGLLARLVLAHHLDIVGVNLVESDSEDHVDKDKSESRFHQNGLNRVDVCCRSHSEATQVVRLSHTREHHENRQVGEDRGRQLGTKVHKTLGDGHLSGDNGGEGNSRVEVSTADIGEAENHSDCAEPDRDSTVARVVKTRARVVVTLRDCHKEEDERRDELSTNSTTQNPSASGDSPWGHVLASFRHRLHRNLLMVGR
mmetsp:Transcript_23030/g.53844  ORF Transcript_23030/g.53844 Transcript_23030/m.53844 type:complete len:277 (-) Transcript_23030:112-942(-)